MAGDEAEIEGLAAIKLIGGQALASRRVGLHCARVASAASGPCHPIVRVGRGAHRQQAHRRPRSTATPIRAAAGLAVSLLSQQPCEQRPHSKQRKRSDPRRPHRSRGRRLNL